jgi:uncharacterized protein (DUF362 family)
MAQGWSALRRLSREDGFYQVVAGRPEAVWPTALALFVQAALARPAEEVQRTAGALLSLCSCQPGKLQDEEIHDIDLKLVGWPWAQGNFPWVEPTAWACLALCRAGQEGHPRVQEGMRLLLDRAFDEGGINYGNRHVLGRATQPIPGPTALMLLALQGQGGHPRVAAAVSYLLKQGLDSRDLEHLAWACLALETHPDQPGVTESLPWLREKVRVAYRERQAIPWLRPSPVREALAALALGPHLFGLKGLRKTFLLEPPKPSSGPRRSLGDRVRSVFRGLAVEAATRLRPLPAQTSVHIARADDYGADLAGILQRQYESFRTAVPLKGRRVVLKPNMVEYHRDKVINTNPNVVAAAIELCRREGAAEVIVAEGPGHWRNVEYLVRASGLGEVLDHYQVPFVDLNHDEPVCSLNLGRLTRMEYLYLSRTVARAEVLISIPKLKTHHWVGATLSLKNLFGTLPGTCYGWPKNELHWRGINNSIVDIALTRTPELAIVDGIVGMEGDGPLNGAPKPVGALIMGNDPLAVDATCCRLMGINPEKIGYLVLGAGKKLGLLPEGQIQQVGEQIATLAQPFALLPRFQDLQLKKK